MWFRVGQPIDFVVTVRYDGGTQDGFDVGVFHEGRLVGWEMNKRFNSGMNTLKLRDANFRGDPGDFIVKIRFKGNVFTEKKFATRSHQVPTLIFTIDRRRHRQRQQNEKKRAGVIPLPRKMGMILN